MVAAAVGVGTAVAGVASSNAQAGAAGSAADAANASQMQGAYINQINLMHTLDLLRPYVDAGTSAVGQQRDLLGLNGNDAQQGVINGIQNSPLFQSQIQRGEQSILQNASATGGLRGGNTQAALAQFSPAMLSAEINNRFQQLGGLVNIGQNAAAGAGNAGQAATGGITSALSQIGANNAGAMLAGGRAQAQGFNSIANGLGLWAGGQRPAASSGLTTAGSGFGGGGLMDELSSYGVF
jgi:hypothetical protein